MYELPPLLEREGSWSRRNSIFAISLIGLVGTLFLYVSLTDPSMVWRSVYSQLIDLLNSKDKFSPTFENSHFFISDIFIVVLIVATLFGFGNLLSKVHQPFSDIAIISVFMTLVSIGISAILLALMHILYQWTMSVILLSLAVSTNIISLREIRKNIGILAKTRGQFRRFKAKNQLIIIPIVLTFIFSIFYDIFLPVIDFDAMIYHAEVAKIMFEEHSIPVFKGPSIGIEISGNYPPLFSAIGAGIYALMGRFDDVVLRILPAIFGLPLILGVYKISEKIFHSSGKYSLLLAITTPLFVYNLIITSPTTLIAASIILSVFEVVNIGNAISILRKNTSEQPLRNHPNLLFRVILVGIFMGTALLSSYQSLFYIAIPLITLLVLYFYDREKNNSERKNNRIIWEILFVVIVVAILLGSIWYIRNYLYVGNPFYPWLSSSQGNEAKIFEETKKEIQTVGSIVTFGKLNYDPIDIRTLFRFHPVLFPAFSAVSVVGVIMLLYKKLWKFSWLAAWLILPILLIFSQGTIFPRYLLPLLPPLVISFGFVVAYTIRSTKFFQKPMQISILGLLVLLYVFIGFPVALSNPAVNTGNYPDKMFFIKHAGDKELPLQIFYDGDMAAWKWLRQNANSENRVATFDPRLYYMGDYRNVFALDGHDAVPLYSIDKLSQIKEYLKEHKIKYIFDASSPNSHLFYMLPLTKYLGTSDFPEVFNSGFAHIYEVSYDKPIIPNILNDVS